MMAIAAIFYLFAAVAVVSALLCIVQKNPIASAFWLVATMLALAGIFILLNAQFIGIIQVLVYAGAIMVLFLFVIMLLNLGRTPSDLKHWPARILAGGAAVLLLAQLAAVRHYSAERLALEYSGSTGLANPSVVFEAGNAVATAQVASGVTGAIAQPLFAGYLVPFELTSVLLLTAIVGAVVLAKRKI
jgi:NADH-quinone oxidoreductase subunit J